MSLAHKLYKIGQLVTKEEIKEMIEVTEFKESDYQTIQIDFSNGKAAINLNAVDSSRTMFTKKIGGTSNSYYLYPNFEYQKEKDLYKKFKAVAYTFENSVMVYANESNQKLAQPVWEYIKNYQEDILELKSKDSGNYFLIITIDGKTIYELMPEIWENYYDDFVDVHISKKIKGINTPQLKEEMDFITHKKELCGYNPNIKFFTMDNYHDGFKPQIINKLPMSKETAIAIKKGWMYAISHLKFYHKGLEYIIIPSMVNYDEETYQEILTILKDSKSIKSIASNEGFLLELFARILKIDKSIINSISLDIYFTEVNLTNLSVKFFGTLEDVLPSRINKVVDEMTHYKISDSIKRTENAQDIYLREYFSREELFAISTKNTASMKNKIIQEKIYLAKLILGYVTIDYIELLKRFEFDREYDYEHKKKLSDEGIKDWIIYPNSFVSQENIIIDFLTALNAIKNRR